jgi:hypothetical protein
MKNATQYEKKIKKLLTGLKTTRVPKVDEDPVRALVRAVMDRNASVKQVEKAMALFDKEFVNLNEFRVAQPREIVELLGKSFPWVREKAEEAPGALNRIFQRANELNMAYMIEMPKRQLRRHLGEIGLSPFAGSRLLAATFEGHAVPVDEDLVEALAMDGMIDPNATIDDVQGFLERIVSHKDCLAAHELLRRYVDSRADALAKKRKADEAARLAAERKAAAEAAKAQKAAEEKAAAEAKAAEEAAAAAEAKAKAAAEAKVAAAKAKKEKEKAKKAAAKKKAREAAKKAAAKAKAAEKAAAKKAKKSAKKAVKKTAKKTVKKTAKKTVKKTAKKAVKKSAKKAVKKAAKKAAKKAVKKTAKK